MKKTFFLLVVVFLGFGNTDAQTEAEKLDEIDAMITSFMAKHKITGLSVGLLYKGKNELITHGREGLTINDSTTFEIGSVTKTFTTYLLAKAIETKKLNLNTTVGELLPTIKNKAVSTITLEELARHTSGLKTNPTTLKRRKKTLDPSELFTEKEFFASLEKEKVSKKKK